MAFNINVGGQTVGWKSCVKTTNSKKVQFTSLEHSNIQRQCWIGLPGCYLDLHTVLAELNHIIINNLLNCRDLKVCYQSFYAMSGILFLMNGAKNTWEEKVRVV